MTLGTRLRAGLAVAVLGTVISFPAPAFAGHRPAPSGTSSPSPEATPTLTPSPSTTSSSGRRHVSTGVWWAAEPADAAAPEIPAGGLWLSSGPDQDEAVSALRIDVRDGVQPKKLVLHIHEQLARQVAVDACPPAADWSPPSTTPGDPADKPLADCTEHRLHGILSANSEKVLFDLSDLPCADIVELVLVRPAGATAINVTFERPVRRDLKAAAPRFIASPSASSGVSPTATPTSTPTVTSTPTPTSMPRPSISPTSAGSRASLPPYNGSGDSGAARLAALPAFTVGAPAPVLGPVLLPPVVAAPRPVPTPVLAPPEHPAQVPSALGSTGVANPTAADLAALVALTALLAWTAKDLSTRAAQGLRRRRRPPPPKA